MAESDSPQLAELAGLIAERNAVDDRIARLLGRPANVGAMGEWIAARIFDIELETAANNAGFDGRFVGGPFAGKTVNVKMYTRQERVLDIIPHVPLDFYLVFTGPAGAPASSRGTTRLFCIDRVFLFDAHELHDELQRQGVKVGIATSVRAAQWDANEIFPQPSNPLLTVTDVQCAQLRRFRCG